MVQVNRPASRLILSALRIAFAAAVAALAAAPLMFRATDVVLLTEFMSMLVLAISWNLLAGYADIVTVGQHPLSASVPMPSSGSQRC